MRIDAISLDNTRGGLPSMDSNTSISAFLITCLIIELTPGPNMGFLALVAATKGRLTGFFTVAGIALGLVSVGLLAAIGVAAIIERSVLLYELLRWGGGAYLMWLAFQQWREVSGGTLDSQPDASRVGEYFRYGLIVNLLNPKAAVFYIAILPSYLHTDGSLGRSTML
jgi:threonine/homoserine/homoserine lactone efflux protein